jgi:mono/diheme cytochrome c family protein
LGPIAPVAPLWPRGPEPSTDESDPDDPERTSVTEIPEHLLKRSRDRRAALGLGGDDAGSGDAKPAATPATTAGAAPAAAAPSGPVQRAAAPSPAAPPPPKPDTPVVAAYKRRKRVPFWAMTALGLLPVWAFMYVRAVTAQPQEASGPLGVGAEIYGNCASCHGAGGGGGTGYAFTGGEVLKTFPHIEDQLRYVYFGTAEYNLAGVDVYGNPDREGGAHVTGAKGVMPGWGADIGGALPDFDILAVVCHERYTLGGADPAGDYADEFETWCSEGSEIYADLESGGHLSDLDTRFEGIMPIGDAPVPGSPAAG